ncbi:MAG: PASTA domain-containing protein [Bacteroidetes bacterium]|nr:PASTA domain-containing protein [Bacteroidota bacterium]
MKKLFKFICSRVFVINFTLATLLIFVILFGTYKWLNGYTNHGETITVPDLKGMKFKDLEAFLEGKSFQVKVADSSVFILDKPPGVVIDQDPAPNMNVKEGRTIYVTVTRTVPPQVKIPNLIDVSQRQAEAILASYGLKVGQIIYKPDLAKNAVLSLMFNGAEIKAGADITKGAVIDLVLGDGIGNTEVEVPSLKGLTVDEALFVLQGSSLNPGAMVYDESVEDSAAAKVYRQVPEPGDSIYIKQGEAIDLFFTQTPDKLK